MTIFHLLSTSVYPQPGGMQRSVWRIAKTLASLDQSRVIVYVRRQSADHPTAASRDGVEIVDLSDARDRLLESVGASSRGPAESSPSAQAAESFRIDYLLLRNAVEARCAEALGAAHLLVSFYISSNGFIAQQVAQSLGLPHIATVRGSDFSRDFRNPYSLPAIRFVVENASLVVTTNQEQADTLAGAVPSASGCRTIHNALDEAPALTPWVCPDADIVRLFSDGGFSLKKGSAVLLDAVGELLDEGLPVSLVIAGSPDPRAAGYWERQIGHYRSRFGDRLTILGQVPEDQIGPLLDSSHIYCSSSLSEGCSLSRIRALMLGIPIVATRSGVLPELADGCPCIRLCPPGDAAALARELRAMVTEVQSGVPPTDPNALDRWRRHFSPERERAEWRSAVEDVLARRAR